MNLHKKRQVLGDKIKKNQAKKARGIFVEAYAVAPAPSRDYYALQLFQKKFLWTRWRICHGPNAAPTQKTISLDDYKKDATLQHELTYIFGTDTTNLIDDLANQKWSLSSMPSNVLQKILSYMTVSDILRLSQVCKRLSKECSSNQLWKAICKKQWKILIHNDIEKAGLIGWKTVYLEKMRPKRYKIDSEHHHHHGSHPHPHLHSRPVTNLSRIQSISTLNSPASRGFTAKSNMTMPKRVQELKRCDAVRSSSEIYGKDFKVTSMMTGKSTERTYTLTKGKTCSRNWDPTRPTTGDKLTLTPRKYLQQSSSSSINLTDRSRSKMAGIQRGNVTSSSAVATTAAVPPVKCKVTSIRARSATTQSAVQPVTFFGNKLRGECAGSIAGKSHVKRQ